MNKLVIRRRTHDGMLQEGGRDMLVSLPAPPFQLDVTSDRPETDPRSMPVRRCDLGEPGMKKGEHAHRLWQYAQSVNWNCTLREAAEALGIPPGIARISVSRRGFLPRFKGSRRKAEAVFSGMGMAEVAAIASKSRGVDVDENLLPLDRLIR